MDVLDTLVIGILLIAALSIYSNVIHTRRKACALWLKSHESVESNCRIMELPTDLKTVKFILAQVNDRLNRQYDEDHYHFSAVGIGANGKYGVWWAVFKCAPDAAGNRWLPKPKDIPTLARLRFRRSLKSVEAITHQAFDSADTTMTVC